MSLRSILVLVLAFTLSGCFEGSSGSTATGGASSTGSGSIASTSPEPPTTPLVLDGVPAVSVVEGSEYSFKPSVASATGVVTFAVNGLPSWATFDPSTGTLSGTPSAAAVGTTADITIMASDGSGTGSVGPFVIRIDPETPTAASAPPVISGTPVLAVISGQTYVFQPAAGDAAGNPLTFAITNCPVWAAFSTATGKLSGVPTAAQAGIYSSINIRVTDGTLSAALPAFTIVVTAATPDMPVIGGAPATTVVAGQPYSFQPVATDPAGKPLTFSIMHPPVWATFSTASGKLSGTPSTTQSGAYTSIVISADNGTQISSLSAFAIQVTPVPAPDSPSISGMPGTSVTAGQAYRFQPTANDPAGKALTFSIVNRPTWANFDAATGILSGTPGSQQAGSYPGIVISVLAGSASASLPVFGITVSAAAPSPPAPTNGSATLTWTAPTTNTDFTPLTDLAGYRIYYGKSNSALTQTMQITDSTAVTALILGLSSGTWYFEVMAYNSANVDSGATAVASKTIM